MRLHQVCHKLHDVVGGSAGLQYRIKLRIAGYVDEGSDERHSPTSDRMRLLNEHVERWRNLQWTERTIEFPAWHPGSPFAFEDGILCVQDVPNSTLSFIKIPDRDSPPGEVADTWSLGRLNQIPSAFAINPALDLTAHLEIQ